MTHNPTIPLRRSPPGEPTVASDSPQVRALIDAALDQPHPTRALREALAPFAAFCVRHEVAP